MHLTPVNSSHIHAVGYDPTSGALHMQFKAKDGSPGPIWHYEGVPGRHYSGMIGAPSIGGYFHANIRNRYRARKLEE